MYLPLSSLLPLVLALAGPAAARQDTADWRLETTQGTRVVRETAARGFGALPLSTLVSLGARVSYEADGATARLGSRDLRFRVGSAEVATGEGVLRLAHPVYEDDGVLYLPADFFRVHLPVVGPPVLSVDAGTRTLRRVAPVASEEPQRGAGVVASSLEYSGDTPLRRVALTETGRAVRVRTDRAVAERPSSTPRPLTPAASVEEASASLDDSATADVDIAVDVEEGDTTPGRARAARPRRPSSDRAASDRPSGARNRRLVVIDAGHGGRDPGARGPTGVREKDVTLGVARRVAEILRRDPSLEVRMTRDRDTLIALRDRTRLANGWKREGQAALFLSIHANANPSPSARGFETYFLSEAKTADAKRVEAMENAAVEFEEEHTHHGNALDFIFNDLRQNQYLRESSDWAAIIQDQLAEAHPGPNRGVKQAGFFVLNGAFMPAVLVEVGFLTNRGEEQTLADRSRQHAIAEQLAEAVQEYFQRAEPAAPRRGAAGSRD